MLDLPWTKFEPQRFDRECVTQLLQRTHGALHGVQARILRLLGSCPQARDLLTFEGPCSCRQAETDGLPGLLVRPGSAQGPASVLCLAGPRGTGKTSLAQAIAQALGRTAVGVSLDGEATERQNCGYRRRTPGCVVEGLREARVNNPVFILEAIDQVGDADEHTEPLLGVLDSSNPVAASSRAAWIHVGATPDELYSGHGNPHGSVVHVLYSAVDVVVHPLTPRRVVVFHGLRRVRVVPTSVAPRSVPVRGPLAGVSIPIAIEIPRALQTSCARSMFGLCPLRSDRNASCGRPASVAARFVLQPRCFNCASTSSASRRLTGPVGFVLIAVFTSVLGIAVRHRAWRRPSVPARLCFRITAERVMWSKPAVLDVPGNAHWRTGSRPTAVLRFRRVRHVGSGFAPRLSSWALFWFRRRLVAPDFRGGRCTSVHACAQDAVCSHSVLSCAHVPDCACDAYSRLFRPHAHGRFLGDGVSVSVPHPPPCDVRCRRVTEISASISFLREQLGALDRQREALDSQRVRLTEALEVLERDVSPALPLAGRGPAPVVARPTPPEEPATLAARILDVLRTSGPLNRREFLQAFADTTVKPGTLDSALYRLKRRGLVEKRGTRFAVVEPQPSDAGYDGEVVGSGSALSPSGSDRSSGPVDVSVDQDEAHTEGEVDVVC